MNFPVESSSLGPVVVVLSSGIKVILAIKNPFMRWWKGEIEPEDLAFLGDKIGIVIGDGNLHALQDNPDSCPSDYICSAAGHLLAAAGKLRPEIEYVDADNISKNKNLGGVLLGGPVANEAYRQYCGYTMSVPSDGKAPIPSWSGKGGLRWGFFLGIGEWGYTPTTMRLDTDSLLEPLSAIRMKPDGSLMEKEAARYGIVDNSGGITMLRVDANKRLVEDFALITRLERRDAPGRYLTMIAGAHGYATAAFGRDWRKSGRLLREISEKHGQEYQALIPATINYSAKDGVEAATLDFTRTSVASVQRKI